MFVPPQKLYSVQQFDTYAILTITRVHHGQELKFFSNCPTLLQLPPIQWNLSKTGTLYKANKYFAPTLKFAGQTWAKVISMKEGMAPIVSALERFKCNWSTELIYLQFDPNPLWTWLTPRNLATSMVTRQQSSREDDVLCRASALLDTSLFYQGRCARVG